MTALTAAKKTIELLRLLLSKGRQQQNEECGNGAAGEKASRDMPELFYYAGVNVDSFGEAGLPALAEKARGQWIVISETDQYPAYSTLLKQIPNAFPQGLKKLHMPDVRDKIYVGWYDPPAGANTKIQWSPRNQIDSEE